jgi:hypothetical protein
MLVVMQNSPLAGREWIQGDLETVDSATPPSTHFRLVNRILPCYLRCPFRNYSASHWENLWHG